ncbi:MAG: glycosyl hydrolase family 65 protein [Lactovum sp.]
MAGHWLSVIRGFANVYVGERLEISPSLPQEIQKISFLMYYENNLLKIEIKNKYVKIENKSMRIVDCLIFNKGYKIKGGEVIEISK